MLYKFYSPEIAKLYDDYVRKRELAMRIHNMYIECLCNGEIKEIKTVYVFVDFNEKECRHRDLYFNMRKVNSHICNKCNFTIDEEKMFAKLYSSIIRKTCPLNPLNAKAYNIRYIKGIIDELQEKLLSQIIEENKYYKLFKENPEEIEVVL